ncbi:MAG TPA: VWA domain-containing protein [Thermoanaerobaculia bacterium]|nr:VWA domain-containing protein [Thermoanaerobaculia bacterium]
MPIRLFAVLLVVAMSVSVAAPQQPLVESIEVRVANIDVVVRDKSGNPVTGLTKDDFELYEDGTKQPITNLYEVRRNADVVATQPSRSDETPSAGTPAAPVEQRPRKLILFVDSFSLQPSRRAPILAAVEKFIDRQMKPEDQAMLVSWRLSVNVITPFTSDKAVVRSGIDTLARAARGPDEVAKLKSDIQELIRIASSGSLMMSMDEAHAKSLQLVDAYAADLILREENLLNDLGRMSSTLAGVEGKKVLVFAGENLPEHPGADLYRYVNAQFASYLSRNSNPLDMQVLTGVTGNRMQQTIANVANQAGAYGVTIYTIDAADMNSDFSAANGEAPDLSESFSRNANTAAALQTIASITGGVAIANTTNFDLAFDTIARDLDSYYSLGYKPRESGRNSRRIVVKTKNRTYTVRTPETFILRSSEDQMNDRTIANLYADVPSAWPVAIRTGSPKKDGRGIYEIPVQVAMASTLTLLPEGKDLVGGFVLYFTVGSVAGGPSEVMRRPVPLRIPATAEAGVRAKPMTFRTTIRVKEGESTLSVGVIDQTSATTGFARLKLVAR